MGTLALFLRMVVWMSWSSYWCWGVFYERAAVHPEIPIASIQSHAFCVRQAKYRPSSFRCARRSSGFGTRVYLEGEECPRWFCMGCWLDLR